MQNANRIIPLALLITLIGWSQIDNSLAQDDARRALVGAWEGTVTQQAGSAPTRLEFSEQGDKLVWKWNWDARIGKGEAEGTVTKHSGPSVEMSGRYTSHPLSGYYGAPITMSLTVTGNQMHGNGFTKANIPFSLSVTKK